MKYTQTTLNRVFILRLGQDEILHETVERFAREQNIRSAILWAVGGADAGSQLVVGPRNGAARPVIPLFTRLPDVHEITGFGTLFPDPAGLPVLHMHIAAGRRERTRTGCVRAGVKVWQILEIVLLELGSNPAARVRDAATGFNLLDPVARARPRSASNRSGSSGSGARHRNPAAPRESRRGSAAAAATRSTSGRPQIAIKGRRLGMHAAPDRLQGPPIARIDRSVGAGTDIQQEIPPL